MITGTEETEVLQHISILAGGMAGSPVTLGELHGSFTDMDVRDLVRHLEILFRSGIIENADQKTGRLGNRYILTTKGAGYLAGIYPKLSG